jgi:hypothetical protein
MQPRFILVYLVSILLSIAHGFAQENLTILMGPYLMDFGQTRMTVMWETNLPSTSVVKYGEAAPLESRTESLGLSTIHEVRIEGLQTETMYYYQVLSESAVGGKTESHIATFQTAIHPENPFSYCVIGDNRTYPENFTRIADLAYAERPNFVLNVGDVVSTGTEKAQWLTEFFFPARKLMARIPTYIAIGNHEKNADWFYKYVSYPTPENYYSFDFGNAHFAIVDSNQDLAPGSPQHEWLQKDLTDTRATWKFVAHHHPPYSSDIDDYGDTAVKHERTDRGEVELRKWVVPLYEATKVDVVWCGHIHDYERTWPLRDGKVHEEAGVIYIQSGGGGAELEDFAPTRSWFTAKVYRGWQFCYVTIQGNHFRMMAYDIDGRMYDYLELNK